MSRASLAFENLRGFVISMVLAFHSFMAYMTFQPLSQSPFDSPPYDWQAHPIIDSNRWWGFDLFGAYQFLHLMQLMFFLSGLFVWPSLARKGVAAFLPDRIMRLGVPFIVGVFLLMPLAYFPAYCTSSDDPSWSGFWSHWFALPFWPSGPIWFLWFILVLNVTAASIYWLVPRSKELVGSLSVIASNYPRRVFVGFIITSALLYLPLARLFEPWQWFQLGPFALQPSLAPQYVIYFLAGLILGARGIDRGLLKSDGVFAQRWTIWLVGAFAAFLLWVVAAALIETGAQIWFLGTLRELGLILFAAGACCATVAFFLHFARRRGQIFWKISENAYGIYLFHYVFVIWTQYSLLQIPMPAVIKGTIVLSVTLVLSWATAAGISSIPVGARVMRGERRTSMAGILIRKSN